MERIRSSVPAWRSKRTRVRVVCTVAVGPSRVWGGEAAHCTLVLFNGQAGLLLPSASASTCLRLHLPVSTSPPAALAEGLSAGPSAQRATATKASRAEGKLDPCAQLSEAGS